MAFRHALAGWDFPAAAGASDRLLPVVVKENQWISGVELRDGAVMAKLHLGDAAGPAWRSTACGASPPGCGRPSLPHAGGLRDAAESRQATAAR